MEEYVYFYQQSELRPLLEELIHFFRDYLPNYPAQFQLEVCREVSRLCTVIEDFRPSFSHFKKILDDNWRGYALEPVSDLPLYSIIALYNELSARQERSNASRRSQRVEPNPFLPHLSDLIRHSRIQVSPSIKS